MENLCVRFEVFKQPTERVHCLTMNVRHPSCRASWMSQKMKIWTVVRFISSWRQAETERSDGERRRELQAEADGEHGGEA
jgi:hypothetical protein